MVRLQPSKATPKQPIHHLQWLLRSCGARQLATRALVLQAIEEPARTSRTSTELLDVNKGFELNLQ